jgi:hypothetical protein
VSRPKSSKIYVRVGERLFDFMWFDIIADGSILMGLRFKGHNQIELVSERDGQLRPPQIEAPLVVSQPKISFHPSGHYKLDASMGKVPNAMDRSTVVGPRLQDIAEPRRMLELLLPQRLPVAQRQPTIRDIVLDASTAPHCPLACTVSCMSTSHYQCIVSSDTRFVDTSTWEFTHALEHGAQAWTWTLRTSIEATAYPNRFILGLLGQVKWGREFDAGAQ